MKIKNDVSFIPFAALYVRSRVEIVNAEIYLCSMLLDLDVPATENYRQLKTNDIYM